MDEKFSSKQKLEIRKNLHKKNHWGGGGSFAGGEFFRGQFSWVDISRAYFSWGYFS